MKKSKVSHRTKKNRLDRLQDDMRHAVRALWRDIRSAILGAIVFLVLLKVAQVI